LISAGVIYTFIHALNQGESLEKARTIAVTTMVLFQFFQAFNSRSELRSLFRMNHLGNEAIRSSFQGKPEKYPHQKWRWRANSPW
jgi:hypothetical protein